MLHEPAPLVIQKCAVRTTVRKRKSISSSIDLGNLPRRRGHKKQKSEETPSPKVLKPQDATVDLDDSTVNLLPPQTSPSIVQPEKPTLPTAKVPHGVHPLVPTKCPPNSILDEDYAWKTFKGIISEIEVSECYDMLVKDFEHSAIHDLFKVGIFLITLISFFYEI